LQLFAEGFDGTATQGSAFLFPVFIVDMFLVRSEVSHFPGNRLADFRGTFGLGLGFEQVLKPVDKDLFIAVAAEISPVRPTNLWPVEFRSRRALQRWC
jgi:hypothetical protein